MKIKTTEIHNVDKVPDHIQQEVMVLASRMMSALSPVIKDVPPQYILGALNFVQVSIIKYLIVDERGALENAAKNCAISILKNMEGLIEKMEAENANP